MIVRADAGRLPLAAGSVDLIFADPPYPREYLPCYGWLAEEAARVLKPGAFVLAMCGGVYLDEILAMFRSAGLAFYWCYQMEMVGAVTGIVWPRGNQRVNISTRSKHIVAYSNGDGLSRTCTTGSFRSDGLDKRYHAWGQDVSSARYFVDCFSAPGDLVLDPFIGGGTTAVACELIGRRWIGSDLDPAALATTAARMRETDIPRALPLFGAGLDGGTEPC